MCMGEKGGQGLGTEALDIKKDQSDCQVWGTNVEPNTKYPVGILDGSSSK